MSLALLRQELRYFLANTDAKVLCVTGRWGVGKTYAWATELKAALAAKRLGANSYAYVSLFGQGSLDDVRNSIWENTVPASLLDVAPNFETIEKSINSARKNWKKITSVARFIPGLSEYANLGNRALFMLVRNQLICIDDLERTSSSLQPIEILGLLSHLREQKNCQVALLLNEDALSGENAVEFRRHLEKVADRIVHLSPTASEAANIGITTGHFLAPAIKSNCVKLGLKNIRTIRKVQELCLRAFDILNDVDERVRRQAAHSLTLFAFCRFQPDDAPSLDQVLQYSVYDATIDEVEGREPSNFRALLREYDFGNVDELDATLLEGVRRGGFDEANVRAAGETLDRRYKLGDMDASFRQAWDKYHDGFEDNQDEVMDDLVSALCNNVEIVSPSGLDSAVRLLKDLGRPSEATRIIEFYVSTKSGDRSTWDLGHFGLGDSVHDPDVRAAFLNKLSTFPEERTPLQSLQRLASDGWSSSDVERAVAFTEDELFQLFKSLRGAALSSAVHGALSYARIANAGERERKLVANAQAALRRIAAESPINRRRIFMKYGIAPTES